MTRRFAPAGLFAWLVLCFLLIYVRDVGQGFLSDDFGWILRSRLRTAGDVAGLFTSAPSGFFRPLVALSFGLNEWMTGVTPMGYALFNIGLALGTVAVIIALARALGFPALGGVFAAGLWALNFHSMRMALLWISGRTSLLVAFFAAVAALAFAKKRFITTGCFTLCALLSKEEPVMLPVVFAVWAWIDARADTSRTRADASRIGEVARAVWPSWLALVLYAALRAQTNAFTPATAPASYKLTIAPGIFMSNVISYADRSLTLTAAVLILGWLAFSRVRPRLTTLESRTAAKGLVWLVLGFAVTVGVPVRSSLYVCYPAIGASLIGLSLGSAVWRTMSQPRRTVAAIALIILPLLLLPVYRARNVRTKEEARLSARVTSRIRAAIERQPDIQRIVVYDDPNAQPSVASAFSWALPEAVELTAGRPLRVDLVGMAELARQPSEAGASVTADRATLQLAVKHGEVVTLP